jgi:hypothetical protein
MTPVFPYPSGYTVFAGNCTDNNPVGYDSTHNKFYNNPGTTTVSVSPGATSTATVPLYDLPVTVVDGTGAPVVGATLTASETTGYASPYNAICTNGGAAGSAPTIGLVTTDASGTSLTAVPLGHWTINATAGTKTGSVKVWRRITGVFNVTTGGASTGSAIPTVTVPVA